MVETTPFTHPMNVRTLPRKGRNVVFSAPDDVRQRIADAYGLLDVEVFEATALLEPWKRDGVQITGRVKTRITQPCAITSEPLEAIVDEGVEVIFVPDGSRLSKPRTNDDGELILDPEGADLPETFVGDSIDLAAVWLEFFALGLDPFARKEGAEFVEPQADNDDPDPNSPFATLSSLKKH